jgi:hypothetical protein
MGEGVTCERCHGPGELHVQAMEEGEEVEGSVLRMPTEEFCLGCHRAKPSHTMICSNCHVQREQHALAMRARVGTRTVFDQSEPPNTEEECYNCHGWTASHLVLKDSGHFSFEEARKKIAHTLDHGD